MYTLVYFCYTNVKPVLYCFTQIPQMATTESHIRKFNFRLLDKILHDGNFEIVGNSYTNPLDEVFDKPLNRKKTTSTKKIVKHSKNQMTYETCP